MLVEPDGAALTQIATLIDEGNLLVEVERTYPLAQAAEAHRHGEQGRTRGKLVLTVP
ncbi:zinc-binding dehydrogenase [Nonomuraea salmonea]|uniref:zinc-binding dehydrogenase n=1 Tax=Nonomuraea salmonea TaxID=46181 RepID=UPI003CD08FAC